MKIASLVRCSYTKWQQPLRQSATATQQGLNQLDRKIFHRRRAMCHINDMVDRWKKKLARRSYAWSMQCSKYLDTKKMVKIADTFPDGTSKDSRMICQSRRRIFPSLSSPGTMNGNTANRLGPNQIPKSCIVTWPNLFEHHFHIKFKRIPSLENTAPFNTLVKNMRKLSSRAHTSQSCDWRVESQGPWFQTAKKVYSQWLDP